MDVSYQILDAVDLDKHLQGLSECLNECVHADAAVSFILPFTREDAEVFWVEKVRPTLVAEEHILVAAFSDDTLAGTVQLIAKLPPNQPHRCEVSKLLVHPSFRKQGIARGLMDVLESEARRLEKSLITLDTRTGDKAEGLYASLGFVAAGIIPNFALDPDRQKLHATTYMYKEL